LRFARERQADSAARLQSEQATVSRQIERIQNLETQLEPYAGVDIAAEVREIEMESTKELDATA